jgi:hypothetical protein
MMRKVLAPHTGSRNRAVDVKLYLMRLLLMAENKVNQSNQSSANSSNGTCSITGCILHLEGTTSSKGAGSSEVKVYKFRVHFKSQKEIQAHAVESMRRVVALRARSGKALPIRDDGSYVDIDHTGGFSETIDDRLKQLEEMTPEERMAAAEYYKQLLAAAQKLQAVGAK